MCMNELYYCFMLGHAQIIRRYSRRSTASIGDTVVDQQQRKNIDVSFHILFYVLKLMTHFQQRFTLALFIILLHALFY